MATGQAPLIPMTEGDVVALLAQLAEDQHQEDQAVAELDGARAEWKRAVAQRQKRSRQVIEAYRTLRDTTGRSQAAFQGQIALELHNLLSQPDGDDEREAEGFTTGPEDDEDDGDETPPPEKGRA